MLPTTPPSSFPHWIGTSFVTSRVTAEIKENSEVSSHRRHYDFCLDCSTTSCSRECKLMRILKKAQGKVHVAGKLMNPSASQSQASQACEWNHLQVTHTISVLHCAHLRMKCSLGISSFLEEISSPSHWVVSLLFLCINRWGRLSYLSLLFLGTLHSNGYIFPFSPLPLASLLFSAICQASSDNRFCLFAFLFLGDGLDPCLL